MQNDVFSKENKSEVYIYLGKIRKDAEIENLSLQKGVGRETCVI